MIDGFVDPAEIINQHQQAGQPKGRPRHEQIEAVVEIGFPQFRVFQRARVLLRDRRLGALRDDGRRAVGGTDALLFALLTIIIDGGFVGIGFFYCRRGIFRKVHLRAMPEDFFFQPRSCRRCMASASSSVVSGLMWLMTVELIQREAATKPGHGGVASA